MTADSETVVRAFFETLSSGDLDGVWSFFDDATTWTVCARGIAGAGTHRGRDIVDGFLAPVRGLFEPGDPKVELQNVVSSGNWVAVEAVGQGRFLDGREYDNVYAFFVEVDRGTIRTLKEYMDSHYVASLQT